MGYKNPNDRKKYEQERFKREYLPKQKRGELVNFMIEKIKDWKIGEQIKFNRYMEIVIPFTPNLTKNCFRMGNNRMYLTKEAQMASEELFWSIKSKKPQFVLGKIWIDILVEKPHIRGDAINYVDKVCDVIKKAINVDDKYFSIRRVDWRIVKNSPKITIGIGQENLEPVDFCPTCGRELPVDPYFIQKSGNTYRICKSCRSRKIKEFNL